MLAASYLPRRWPAKYFHRYESLRPCSGWERVVSSHLATSEFFEYAQNYIRYKLYAFIIFNLFRCFSFSACAIKIASWLHFRSVTTAVLLNLRSATCSSCPSTSRLCCVASFIFFRKSPRPISNAWLKMLPLLHLHPINVVIYNGTY